MENNLKLAINTMYDSLTTIWEDNGNIMAGAVRDNVITNLANITGMSFKEVLQKVEKLIEERQ